MHVILLDIPIGMDYWRFLSIGLGFGVPDTIRLFCSTCAPWRFHVSYVSPTEGSGVGEGSRFVYGQLQALVFPFSTV